MAHFKVRFHKSQDERKKTICFNLLMIGHHLFPGRGNAAFFFVFFFFSPILFFQVGFRNRKKVYKSHVMLPRKLGHENLKCRRGWESKLLGSYWARIMLASRYIPVISIVDKWRREIKDKHDEIGRGYNPSVKSTCCSFHRFDHHVSNNC